MGECDFSAYLGFGDLLGGLALAESVVETAIHILKLCVKQSNKAELGNKLLVLKKSSTLRCFARPVPGAVRRFALVDQLN